MLFNACAYAFRLLTYVFRLSLYMYHLLRWVVSMQHSQSLGSAHTPSPKPTRFRRLPWQVPLTPPNVLLVKTAKLCATA